MKTITVRVDDRLDSVLASLAKTLKTTKSEVVGKAVLNCERNVSRNSLCQRVRRASLKVWAQTSELRDFDAANSDGL